LLSNGDGTYRDAAENVPPQPDETHRSTAADVDRDGDVDIYVGNLGGGGISPYLLLNDGSGKFSKAKNALPADVTNLSRNWYTTCGLVDVNNDHYPDLILGQGDSYKPSHVYLNNGSGQYDIPSFNLPTSLVGDTQLALDIDPIDLNSDKWIDLAVIYTDRDYTRRAIQLLVNQGGTSFKDETEERISQSTHGNWIRFLHVHDFNNDDAPDFAIGILGEKSALYMNDGDGAFTKSKLNFDLFSFAAGDFDGDGWLDLVNSGSAYRGSPEFHSTFISQGCP